jgi:hypothetical protein
MNHYDARSVVSAINDAPGACVPWRRRRS